MLPTTQEGIGEQRINQREEIEKAADPTIGDSHVSTTMDSDMDSMKEVERAETKQSSNGDSPTLEDDIEKTATQPDLEAGKGPRAKRVVTAQDWTGPDDPENPWNWPMWKRTYHITCVALMGFTVTFASSSLTPAVPEIMNHFHVSETAALLGLSLYTLGLACGPIIAAPLSETFGRNIVYRLSLPVFMLFILGSGLSKTFGSLLVTRLFAGLAGSPCLAIGAGTNADLFPPRWRAYATSAFLVAPFLGPAIGPLVGGFAAQFKGWRWTQWCILFAGAGVYIFALGMQETYKKIILQRRAKRLGIEPPKGPKLKGMAGVKLILTVTLFRPLHMLLREPIVLFFSMYSAFTFALLFAFFASFPLVFTEVYNFNTYQNGLVFIAVGLGVIIAWATSGLLDWFVYQKKYTQAIAAGSQHVAPEHRLYGAMVGSLGISIGVFWFAWTARRGVHWISPVLAEIPFAFGNASIFTATALYLVDVYGPLNGASAMAANALARYLLGAAFPLFTVQMYNNLGIPWATSLLGFLSLLMLPIPWVFFKYGPKARQSSHYETTKF